MENAPPQKTVPEMIKEAMKLLSLPATPADIVRWIVKQHPEVHESTIRTQITACCVNMPSRVNFAPNEEPRIAQDPALDILYRLDFGQYAVYDPREHGVWEVADFGGELVVREVEAGSPAEEEAKAAFQAEMAAPPPQEEPAAPEPSPQAKAQPAPEPTTPSDAQQAKGGTMPNESKNLGSQSHMLDLIKSNLGMLEEGMKLFTDSQGVPGVGYKTPLGPIELLVTDARGSLVLVRFDEGSPSADLIGDLCAQLGWVQENLSGKRGVRGVILTREASEQLKYAIKAVPGITLMQYEFKFEVRPLT